MDRVGRENVPLTISSSSVFHSAASHAGFSSPGFALRVSRYWASGVVWAIACSTAKSVLFWGSHHREVPAREYGPSGAQGGRLLGVRVRRMQGTACLHLRELAFEVVDRRAEHVGHLLQIHRNERRHVLADGLGAYGVEQLAGVAGQDGVNFICVWSVASVERTSKYLHSWKLAMAARGSASVSKSTLKSGFERNALSCVRSNW
jgi:hypothetical protein